LGEEREAYDVEIIAGGVAVRTAAVAEPSFRYSAAAQAADFGTGIPTAFTLRVYQISNTLGRGAPLETTIHV
jgi:hypothetical protein